jgi:ribosomal protein S18 acetylase RimI-like enzyme
MTPAAQARAATASDEEFLRALFFQVRAPEFAPAGLPHDQLVALLSQQYDAMRTYYAEVYPNTEYRILEIDGSPIGYEAVRESEEIHLIDIALDEAHRNQGIGTRRMTLLFEQAERAGKSIILSVEVFNPAQRLYERLGFVQYDEYGLYRRMRWICPLPVS